MGLLFHRFDCYQAVQHLRLLCRPNAQSLWVYQRPHAIESKVHRQFKASYRMPILSKPTWFPLLYNELQLDQRTKAGQPEDITEEGVFHCQIINFKSNLNYSKILFSFYSLKTSNQLTMFEIFDVDPFSIYTPTPAYCIGRGIWLLKNMCLIECVEKPKN